MLNNLNTLKAFSEEEIETIHEIFFDKIVTLFIISKYKTTEFEEFKVTLINTFSKNLLHYIVMNNVKVGVLQALFISEMESLIGEGVLNDINQQFKELEKYFYEKDINSLNLEIENKRKITYFRLLFTDFLNDLINDINNRTKKTWYRTILQKIEKRLLKKVNINV